MNELKNYHDLKRAQYRGLQNTQMQAFFAAIAINIKRLVFFVSLKYRVIVIVFRSYFSTGHTHLRTRIKRP